MKVDTEGNKVALESEVDLNIAARGRMRDYMARTGLSVPDFAHRINYAPVTIYHFLADRYHHVGRTACNLIRAADDLMRANPIGQSSQVLGELYETENVRVIRDTFQKLLPRPVAYMIYAPPGSQKTFVLEHEVARLNLREIGKAQSCQRAYYVYARQGIRPRDLVRRVAVACGSRVANDIEPMIQGIRFDFRHHRVLLVVDEAQHLSIECFETLRELLDQSPHFSLLFAGSHDLKRKFDEFSATLEQWNSRIIAKVRLPGLERPEAVGIIHREIGETFDGMAPAQVEALIDKLIRDATVRDAFEGNRTYINVRTLTNVLDRIKLAAEEKQIEATT